MRVSNQMLFDANLAQMQRLTEGLFRLQEQLSTGRKINRPSDGPVAYGQILNDEAALARNDQFLRNISRAQSSLNVADGALDTLKDQLIRANELAVQLRSGQYSAADRAATARELREIYDQIIAVGNTYYDGRYVFAGAKTDTKPFVEHGRYIGTAVTPPITITAAVDDTLALTVDGIASSVTLAAGVYATGTALAAAVETAINADPTLAAAGKAVTVRFDTDHLVLQSKAGGGNTAVTITGGSAAAGLGLVAGTAQPAGTYLGDSAEIGIQIGAGTTLTSNLPGDRLFLGAGGGTDLLATIAGLQAALEASDNAGIDTALTNLRTAVDQVNTEAARIGANLNRADASIGLLEDLQLAIARSKSENGDVDFTAAVSKLSLQQTALEATRAAAARVLQQSLLNFLR